MKPDPSLLRGAIPSEVLDVLKAASEQLSRVGVRHVVIGGLAVAANGFPRATNDVDFLVGDEAFVTHPGGFVTVNPNVPIKMNGIAIDLLTANANEPFLAAELEGPAGSFLDAAPLVYMKIKAGRAKDRLDVIELIKAGIDVDAVQQYLTLHAPTFVPLFEKAVVKAAAEE